MLDDIDVKIINSILANSRKPVTEIAKEVAISNVAIQQRLKKLEKKGVIEGYTAKINYKAIGYSTIAFIGLFLEKAKNYRSVISKLNKIPEISEAHFTTGNYSIFAKVYAKNNDHLMEIQTLDIRH